MLAVLAFSLGLSMVSFMVGLQCDGVKAKSRDPFGWRLSLGATLPARLKYQRIMLVSILP